MGKIDIWRDDPRLHDRVELIGWIEDLQAAAQEFTVSKTALREYKIYLGLTAMEAEILSALGKRESLTRGQLLVTAHNASPSDFEAEEKIVDVYICKIRKKLKPFGIKIETIWGEGYRLPPESKKKIGEYIHGQKNPDFYSLAQEILDEER